MSTRRYGQRHEGDSGMVDSSASDVMGGAAAVGNAVGGPIGAAIGMITVTAPAIAGAPQPSSGGGFTFSPEEIDSVITEWEDLRDSLQDDQMKADRMANVMPPGNDFASGDFSNAANPSGKAFLDANQKMRDYVDDYIEALKNARDDIKSQDEQAREAAEQATKGMQV